MRLRAIQQIWPGLALLALLAQGCGEETALDLNLVADPNVNSEQALLAAVDRLRLVVDSPAGLYPPGTIRKEQDFEIKNEDTDPASELVAQVGVDGKLPLIRLEQGGLPDAPLELRLSGYKGGGVALAAGGVEGIHFIPGQIQPIKVPFNLKADHRPPRVTQVFPADGAANLLVGSISSVLVIFSKAMSKTEVERAGVLSVFIKQGDKEVLVPAKSVKASQLYKDGPSQAEYTFVKLLDLAATYHVRVSAKARDKSGRPLDQVPLQAGNQPFSSAFSISSVGTASPMTTEQTWCINGGLSCAPGLVCNQTTGACESKPGCPAKCPANQVCDKPLGHCVDDCRVHGSYGGCDTNQTCGADGLCL